MWNFTIWKDSINSWHPNDSFFASLTVSQGSLKSLWKPRGSYKEWETQPAHISQSTRLSSIPHGGCTSFSEGWWPLKGRVQAQIEFQLVKMKTTPKDVYFSTFVMLFHFRSTENSFVEKTSWFYSLGHIFHHYWRKISSKEFALSVCYINKSWVSPFPLGEDVYINYRQLFTLKRINI